MRLLLLALACTALPFTAHAQSYLSVNQLVVVPINRSDFEVIEARGQGPLGMWCAAADYVRARQGGPRKLRIYIKSPRGNAVTTRGRKGVVFTTNPKGLTPVSGYSISLRQVGYNLPQFHAYEFCRGNLIELRDRL